MDARSAAARLPAGPLPVYDLEQIDFDVSWLVDWVRAQLAAEGVGGPLERLHERVTASEVAALTDVLTRRSLASAVGAWVDARLRDSLPTLPWDALARQTVLQFRVLLPGDARSPAPAHTDHGIGHRLVERNLWAPLTEAAPGRALHALPLRPSLALDAARRASGRRYLDVAAASMPRVQVPKGRALLFTSLHAHGASVNRTPRTRVSVDLRFLPAVHWDGHRWTEVR